MQPLSQYLEELAAWVKVLEGAATATFESDRAQVERRRQEIDAAFKTELGRVESAVRETADAYRTWWTEMQAWMTRWIEEARRPPQDARTDVRPAVEPLTADLAVS